MMPQDTANEYRTKFRMFLKLWRLRTAGAFYASVSREQMEEITGLQNIADIVRTLRGLHLIEFKPVALDGMLNFCTSDAHEEQTIRSFRRFRFRWSCRMRLIIAVLRSQGDENVFDVSFSPRLCKAWDYSVTGDQEQRKELDILAANFHRKIKNEFGNEFENGAACPSGNADSN